MEKQNRYQHALVIGGTGMLQEAAIGLKELAATVSVISRRAAADVIRRAGINPINSDYSEIENTLEKIEGAAQSFGAIDLVVSWIHSNAPSAPFEIAQSLSARVERLEFFEVLGSSAVNPASPEWLNERNEKFGRFANLKYHAVILGFVIENGTSRWLSNSEISKGVLRAVSSNSATQVVGVTEPWRMRP